jgi:formate dehydrogenase subunit gamma
MASEHPGFGSFVPGLEGAGLFPWMGRVRSPQEDSAIMDVKETVGLQKNRRIAEGTAEVWVQRFGRTERFVHWWTVLWLSVAVLTGLSMGDDGGAGPLLIFHVSAVTMVGVGLAAAVVIGQRQALASAGRRLFVVDRRDVAWLRARLHDPFHPDANPRWGMFNAGQKFLAWAVTISVALVVATGIVSWSQGGEGGLHGAAVLLTGLLLGAHVFMAVVNPSTRHALHGMVFGRVRRSWALKHHRAWMEEIEAKP